MTTAPGGSDPGRKSTGGEHHDVVVIGGAVVGSAVAFFLSENPDFDGSILVVERDPTYARSSTALSAASVRHQFVRPVNIRLSQFTTECLDRFDELVGVDGEAPDAGFRETGYLFLAADGTRMDQLRSAHAVQRAEGVPVALLDPDELARRFPHLTTFDLVGGSLGERHEGSLDAFSLLQGFRRRARRNGVEYRHDEVVGMEVHHPEGAGRVRAVRLASGTVVGCGAVVNCAGPRARLVADMAGLRLPVVPRVRSVFASGPCWRTGSRRSRRSR